MVSLFEFEPFLEITSKAINTIPASIVIKVLEAVLSFAGALLIEVMPADLVAIGSEEILRVEEDLVGTAGTLKEEAALEAERFTAFLEDFLTARFAEEFFADFLTDFFADFFTAFFFAAT
mgnify:CR=1 FL=1